MGKSANQNTYRIAAENGLNLRDEPGGKILAVLPFGAQVKELSRVGDWAEIRAGKQRGWVMAEYLRKEAG